MTVANSTIKKAAKSALKNNLINSFVIGIIVLVCYFINQNICSCLSLVMGDIYATVLFAVLNLFLLSPVILGSIRYFWRMLCGVCDNPVSVFYYYSSTENYRKSIEMTFKLIFKFFCYYILFNIPYFALSLISNVEIYESFNIPVPLWTANLSNLTVFFSFIAKVVTVCATLKYYLAPMLIVVDENMEVNEAIHMSVVIAKGTILDCIFLIFSMLGWILLSLFFLPLIFLLPYFITVYLTHCSFAVSDYNEHIKKINNQNFPTFVTGV